MEQEWRRTADVRPNVVLDAFVVMPNHLHGILIIQDTPAACPYEVNRQFGGSIAGTLSTIVGQFKSIVTKRINRHYNTNRLVIWQRNYYERIIRDDRELEHVREYIAKNPVR